MQPPILGVRNTLKRNQFAHTIHVPLNDVSTEAPIGFHRQFQIHQRAFVNARERRSSPGFGRQIGAERSRLDIKRRQANPAYRNAMSRAQFPRSVFSGNRNAPVLSALLDASDASHFFHNAGKHECLPNEQDILIHRGVTETPRKQFGRKNKNRCCFFSLIPCLPDEYYSPYGSRRYPSTAKSSPKRCKRKCFTCAAWPM